MPLHVHCPNGCRVRMPSKRAGKIVRCPKCKSTIELKVSQPVDQDSKIPVELHALLVKSTESTTSKKSSRSTDSRESKDNASTDGISEHAATLMNVHQENIEIEPAALPTQSPDSPPPKKRLEVPTEISPAAIRKNKEERKAHLRKILSVPAPVHEFKKLEVGPQKKTPGRKRRRTIKPPPVVEIEQTKIDDRSSQKISWEERMQKSKADRIVLARFFAFSLCIVAVINMFPAITHWYEWYQAIEKTPLPRWIYLQIFVAAVHVMYAAFLFQIPDWSSMRAVSVAMLVIAFVFGLVSTGLLVAGGQSLVALFLGLSYSLVQRAAIWCVAMLCLATLMSYLGGKEAANWQRSELLLEEILAGESETQAAQA